MNTNKRSVMLDWESKDDQAQVDELLRGAMQLTAHDDRSSPTGAAASPAGRR
jgi:crotonobetainyl-CoA:carnitine CoA-transferase CaiB-like acyl-CoA transferase